MVVAAAVATERVPERLSVCVLERAHVRLFVLVVSSDESTK